MPVNYKLKLKNFRSIRDAEVDIAPLTVMYGPNGSGKSSLIFGLLTLRNFLTNPNQNIPSLFSYPTMSLGGFEEVVANHARGRMIALSLSVSAASGWSEYTLGVGESGGQSAIDADLTPGESGKFNISLDIPFPYRANLSDTSVHPELMHEHMQAGRFAFHWNGLSVSGITDDPDGSHLNSDLLGAANAPIELAKTIAYVPLNRGFTTPVYSVSHVTPTLSTDVEVASLLATERFLEYDVSDYLEKVVDRQVRTRMQPGTSSFNVDSIPRSRDVAVSIVNEGFGINQIAYMLTICLHANAKIVAIEEPEIHLHPSMVRKLVHAMVEITSTMDKRIIVSTHSETFVLSLLAQIAAGKVSVDDVSFIFAEKEDGESRFTKQEVSPEGQIQGGLESFITGELEDMAVLFGPS